jgi:hypothetical protein
MHNDKTARRSSDQLLRWATWSLGAAALAYLIIEHRPHLFGWLPYLVLLACPLMHLFMHRSHRHASSSIEKTPKRNDAGSDSST